MPVSRFRAVMKSSATSACQFCLRSGDPSLSQLCLESRDLLLLMLLLLRGMCEGYQAGVALAHTDIIAVKPARNHAEEATACMPLGMQVCYF